MVTETGEIITDKIAATSYAPGYREFGVKILIQPGGKEVEVRFGKEDSAWIFQTLWEMYDAAFSVEHPLDGKEGSRPGFLSCQKPTCWELYI